MCGQLTNKSLTDSIGSSVVLNVRLTTVMPAGSSSLRNVDSSCIEMTTAYSYCTEVRAAASVYSIVKFIE